MSGKRNSIEEEDSPEHLTVVPEHLHTDGQENTVVVRRETIDNNMNQMNEETNIVFE